MIEKIRKFITIPTVVASALVIGFLSYYAQVYKSNSILIFDKNSEVILLGFSILILLVVMALAFFTFDNRKLIRKVVAYQEEVVKKDNRIEELLEYIINQNEESHDVNLKCHRNTKQLLIDIEKRGDTLGA